MPRQREWPNPAIGRLAVHPAQAFVFADFLPGSQAAQSVLASVSPFGGGRVRETLEPGAHSEQGGELNTAAAVLHRIAQESRKAGVGGTKVL